LVKLMTKDNQTVSIPLDLAMESGLLRNLLEDKG
jgi:S-phase kinase-associated protein 1